MNNKLISKDLILRFKQGLRILKFLNSGTFYYVGGMNVTPIGNRQYRLKNGTIIKANPNIVKERKYVKTFQPKQSLTLYLDKDGRWFYKDGTYFTPTSTPKPTEETTPKSKPAVSNRRRVNRQQTVTTPTAQPVTTTPVTVESANIPYTRTFNPSTGQFTSVEPETQSPQYMNEPGRYSIGTTLNSGNIRADRNLYRNVDEYYNWLNTDAGANSDDYKLFANTGLWASNISNEDRRAAFNEMMNRYGISGNLGRRDSGRLANLLNDLSRLGSDSKMRGEFVDAYNNALDSTESKLNTSQYTPSSDFTKKLTMLNNPLRYNIKLKKGGILPSRNPIKRFKSFRKEAL